MPKQPTKTELLERISRLEWDVNYHKGEADKLRKQLQERLNQSMIEERRYLVSALGQMMGAVCRTADFVIGKEVM